MFVSKQIALIKFSMFLFWAVSSGVRLKYDSPAIPPKQWVSIATCARFWLDNGFRSGADLVKKICVGVSDLCRSLAGSDNPSWPQRRFIYAMRVFIFRSALPQATKHKQDDLCLVPACLPHSRAAQGQRKDWGLWASLPGESHQSALSYSQHEVDVDFHCLVKIVPPSTLFS